MYQSLLATSERILACAFVAGLPSHVKQLLRASTAMYALPLDELLARARSIVKGERAMEKPIERGREAPSRPDQHVGITCYECNGPNHIAKDCLSSVGRGARVLCHRCDRFGHKSRNCPGNEAGGERILAPTVINISMIQTPAQHPGESRHIQTDSIDYY